MGFKSKNYNQLPAALTHWVENSLK
ncbi:uncharacterized protein METZ01_LOCUS52040 [marine metagenome]|uniref:Uncharacterized protein n=1 Tax=marine metagenome TaxID=408172 RepID=A0A381S534_9ZZZZ